MSDVNAAVARLVEARRAAGAPGWAGPARESGIAELERAVAPLVVPAQVVSLWRQVADAPDWLVDAGDLMAPEDALEVWRECQGPDWPPFPTVLLPIASASHVFLTIELGEPGRTTGGALLRVSMGAIELVAPEMSTALDLVASAIEAGLLRWNGPWWDGIEIEELQRDRAGSYSWPSHLASLGEVDATSPLTWPTVWQRAAGIDPADAEPHGANASVASLEDAPAGSSVRVNGRVLGLAGSSNGTLATIADETGSMQCWCPRTADPFFVMRKGQVVEVEVRVHDAAPLAAPTPIRPSDTGAVLAAAPSGRLVATFVRRGTARPQDLQR